METKNRQAMIRDARFKVNEPRRRQQMFIITIYWYVMLIGCAIVGLYALSAQASTGSYSADESPQIVQATVTAYTSSADETDENPWETASGSRARKGVVACPSKYEFGTRVAIAGREYVCEDRMNKRYREVEHFDVWHESKAEAFAFGKQELEVTIIK